MRTGLHMEEIIKTDSNKQQNNKNSNEEYYDKKYVTFRKRAFQQFQPVHRLLQMSAW